jgi:hypothetical protein
MEGNASNPLRDPAFLDYIEISSQEYYDTFDEDNLFNNFTIVEEPNALSFVWIPFDEMTSRSLINMTSSLSDTVPRTKIHSLKPLVTKLDQQILIEFLTNASQVENLLELWILSSCDSSYIYGSFGIDPSGNTYLSLNYNIEANGLQANILTTSCSPFQPVSEEAYSLIVKTVRPEVELYNENVTAYYEWLAIQNITQDNVIASIPWRIDVLLKHSGTVLCSLSKTPNVTASDMQLRFLNSSIAISQSIYEKNNVRKGKQNQSTTNITVSIDRIWVECQYSICNVTNSIPNENNIKPEYVKQGNIALTALSSITGGLFGLLILAICIPLIIVLLWRFISQRTRKVRQSKLDAWRFEFVLDSNSSSSSSSDNGRIGKADKKLHQDGLKSLFRKNSIIPYEDIEMTDISDSFPELSKVDEFGNEANSLEGKAEENFEDNNTM